MNPPSPAALSVILFAAWFSTSPAAAQAPCYVDEWPVVGTLQNPGFPLAGIVAGEAGIYVTQNAPPWIVGYDRQGTEFTRWTMASLGCTIARPAGIAIAAGDATFVTDPGCHRIQKFDAAHDLINIWGGQGTQPGRFFAPLGIAAASGFVYVADTFNHRVQKFDTDGVFIAQWGTFGTAPGQFNTPHAIATDAAGNVYVLDTFNQRVQVFDPDGAFLRAWGEPGFDPNALLQPKGITVSPAGDVYVADTDNHRIVIFDSEGNVLARFGTHGRGPGQFVTPNGIVVEGDGTVYVLDTGNSRVQKFSPAVPVELLVEPRTIQRRGGGTWVTAALEPAPPRTAEEIVISSLQLNGVPPDLDAPTTIGDQDGDGVDELRVKFSREALLATAPASATILPLTITGAFQDGACLTGQDEVRISGRTQAASNEPGFMEAGIQLATVRPNPTRGAFEIGLRLGGGGPLSIEMFDIGGRRVHMQEEGALGAGVHNVRVRPSSALSPGLYLLRLLRAGAAPVEARVAIVQ